MRNAKAVEHLHGVSHDLPVGLRAHDHAHHRHAHPGNSKECLSVLGRGLGNHIDGQGRRGGRLAPVEGLEVVAHELLVEARRTDAFLVLVDGPEPGGVGGEHLIHEVQHTVLVKPEFKLGVGHDDALLQGVGRGLVVEGQADATNLVGMLLANACHHLLKRDVLVVGAHLGLVGRREDGLGQSRSHREPLGQCDATDCARGLVILPAATNQVATHHGLDGKWLEPLGHHGPAPNLLHLMLLHHRLRVDAGEVVGHDVGQPREPKLAHAVEHHALLWDGLVHDHIECGEAVGGHHEQLVLAHGIEVSNLPSAQQGQRGQAGLEDRRH